MSPLGDYDGNRTRPQDGSLLRAVLLFLLVFAALFIFLTVVALTFDV